MTPRLSLLVEVPPYEDAVAAIVGLRGPRVELVVATDDSRLAGWPGVVRIDAGRDFMNRGLDRASAPAVAVVDAGAAVDHSMIGGVLEAAHHDGTAVVYSDERVAGAEVRKPDWSPAFFRHFNYLGRLVVLPRDLVVAAGGFPPGDSEQALHHLVLRLAGAGVRVHHVPRIAYERLRREPPSLLPIDVGPDPSASVSVLLPTAGIRSSDGRAGSYLAVRALESVKRAVGSMNVEVLVVVGPEVESGVLDELSEKGEGLVRVVRDANPFDFSRRMNLAAASSGGEVLVWLNDDVERHTDDRWLGELVRLALEPDVGAAGGKLLYPSSRVQTVGVRFEAGLPIHVGVGAAPEAPGPLRAFISPREQAAVTGAALATRADVFDEVGGLSLTLPINFGDTDFCLKVRHRGYRVVLSPVATLRHHESASRAPVVEPADVATLLDRWPNVLDPYWPWEGENGAHAEVKLNGHQR